MWEKEIREYLQLHREEMVEDIKALVRINSERMPAREGMPYGPGGAEALKKAEEIIAGRGFSVENHENYVITAEMMDKGDRRLDILAHLDVVPAGEGWTVTEPFQPLEKDGKIYGRGSADDKGPAMAAFYAMRAVKELNIPVTGNVRLILGSDEECGSSDIAYFFKKDPVHAAMTFSPDADFPVINLEKGGLRSTFTANPVLSPNLPRVKRVEGGIKFNVIPASAKAVLEGISVEQVREAADSFERETGLLVKVQEDKEEVLVTVEGVCGHASQPWNAKNAVTGILSFLSRLPLADSESNGMLLAVSRMFPYGDHYGKALGVDLEDEISGKTTLSFDMFSFEEGRLSGCFDMRACVSANDKNTRDVIFEQLEKAGFTTDGESMFPPHHVPEDSPFVQTLLSCYTAVTGLPGKAIAIGGGTYVHEIENGVAFGCSAEGVDNHMHGPDEFVVVEQLMKSAEIFARAIVSLCS